MKDLVAALEPRGSDRRRGRRDARHRSGTSL